MAQVFKAGRMSQQRAEATPHTGRSRFVLVDALKRFEKGIQTLRPVDEDLSCGQPCSGVDAYRCSEIKTHRNVGKPRWGLGDGRSQSADPPKTGRR